MTGTTEATPTRKVSFVIVRQSGTEAELREAIGVTRDMGQSGVDRRHDEVWWKIVQEGSGHDDLSALIGSVLSQVRDLRLRLAPACSAADTTCLLRVVQYVGDDPVGPGLCLTTEQVALLAELHAFIDIDQYWLSPESE